MTVQFLFLCVVAIVATGAITALISKVIITTSLHQFNRQMNDDLTSVRLELGRHLDELKKENSLVINQMTQTIEKKLNQLRETVDEKLQSTLEKRLGDSFKIVSDRLELVHKGLGEMQTLANGVGDLKRVLSNVKNRGTWGEVQLEALLEQVLTPDQFIKNVSTKPNSLNRVEFAIRLPGKNAYDSEVLLPIDAKFPQEDYDRLVVAYEQVDKDSIQLFQKQLENQIKKEAKSIHDKYINPPTSTDFAILFLPLESLFAEVVRRPGLITLLQQQYRVIIAGPTTLTAILNSLQMGFRTLAIEKRSSEVWSLLSTIQKEFGKFGDILAKTQKKLQEASNTIRDAESKSRNIERKLTKVEHIPEVSTIQQDSFIGGQINQEESHHAVY